jgi:hypothetical protein
MNHPQSPWNSHPIVGDMVNNHNTKLQAKTQKLVANDIFTHITLYHHFLIPGNHPM